MSRKRKILLIVAAMLTLSLIVVGAFIIHDRLSSHKDVSDGPANLPEDRFLYLSNSVRVIGIGAYNGAFVEDGSDDAVQGVCAVTLENIGNESVQYMKFRLATDKDTEYHFEVTTLFPGQVMVALEINRELYREGEKTVSTSVENYAPFTETPSLCPDVFEISSSGKTITVKNISSKTAQTGYVYFKNIRDGVLIGGITYRVAFRDLGAKETKDLFSTHFSGASSAIMFVTYVES